MSQFAELLFNTKISTFAQALSQTEPKLNKKSRVTGEPLPYIKVVNCRNINIQLNYNYEKQIIGRDLKEGGEGTFEAQEHTWARKINGALARHKDYVVDMLTIDFKSLDLSKLYIPYVKIRVDSQIFVADGKVIDKNELVDYLPTPTDYANQPQEKKVVVEYMKLASVKEFTCNGIEYQIV